MVRWWFKSETRGALRLIDFDEAARRYGPTTANNIPEFTFF